MLERVPLFNSTRDKIYFTLLCLLIFIFSLGLEYKSYKDFTLYDSVLIKATVQKQYVKSKNGRTYQVLKLKSDDGLNFYTTAKRSLPDLKNRHISLEIWPKELDFYGYISSFFAYSKILEEDETDTLRQKILAHIASSHEDQNISNIYQALFLAAPLSYELQRTFSNLGISHLLAISGFHLGVLSALLFFLLKPTFGFFQDRYFPYANLKAVLFFTVGASMFAYLLFLGSPPSLVRAFAMFVIGFVLYDRGIEVISMQTLLVTVMLLLALFPRLAFTVGFWLSAGGVFYIFLFFIHFKDLKPLLQFILLGVWVYLMMLPLSLALFENFSLYHPLSVLWSILFGVFYPLSIFLHLINAGDILDPALTWLLNMAKEGSVGLSTYVLFLHVVLSFFAVYKKEALLALFGLGGSVFIYSMYNVAQL